MKTNILITLALVLSTMLTGCSKDSENMEEQQLNDIKQHIVGAWEHDGDYYCSEFTEISVFIKDGVVSGWNAEFYEGQNPATIIFNSDGTMRLDNHGFNDGGVTGVYKIYKDPPLEDIFITIKYEEERAYNRYFAYRTLFFEADYNTVYLYCPTGGMTHVGRYRRK